jgi:hypothetical protein
LDSSTGYQHIGAVGTATDAAAEGENGDGGEHVPSTTEDIGELTVEWLNGSAIEKDCQFRSSKLGHATWLHKLTWSKRRR